MVDNTTILSRLSNVGVGLNTFISVNNVYAALYPASALQLLGFPAPFSPALEGMTRMFAATRVVLGITGLAMWWEENYRAMGVSMTVGTLMAAVDGWVSKGVTEQGQWGHWGFAPVGLGVGLGLLWYSEGQKQIGNAPAGTK